MKAVQKGKDTHSSFALFLKINTDLKKRKTRLKIRRIQQCDLLCLSVGY